MTWAGVIGLTTWICIGFCLGSEILYLFFNFFYTDKRIINLFWHKL